MYKNLFDKHCVLWLKDILPLSIAGTLVTTCTFDRCYIGAIDTDETELNIGQCEFHECNVITTIWRSYL